MWKNRFVRLSFILAIVALLALVLSPLIFRFGGSLTIGFGLLSGALVLSLLGALVAVISILWCLFSRPRDGIGRAATALVLCIATAGIPLWQIIGASSKNYPSIHDITTDTDNPPQFTAVMPLRGESSNSTDYSTKYLGDRKKENHYSAIQASHYPDIQPVILNLSHDDTFVRALDAAKAQGWVIVSQAPTLGRIEATDSTFWFGFKDDVVIRLTKAKTSGTRIDVRSSSRVGLGDIGVNANRIRKYVETLTAG